MIAFLYDKTIVMSLITKRTERSLYLSSRIIDGNFVFIIELLALQFITGNDINILGLLSNSDGLFEFSGIVINLNTL